MYMYIKDISQRKKNKSTHLEDLSIFCFIYIYINSLFQVVDSCFTQAISIMSTLKFVFFLEIMNYRREIFISFVVVCTTN